MNSSKIHEDQPLAHAGMASDIELQKQYFEKGKIFILQIESTLACPQLCDYCYADSKPDSPQGLTSTKIREILESAAQMGVRMIDWLGGDPLIREDWYELCQYATSLGLINNIWTSGIPLANKKIAQQVVEVTKNGFISTHLDTIQPEFYKKVHGNGGQIPNSNNIQLILNGIQNCLEFGKDPESLVNCITFTRDLAEGDAKHTIQHFFEIYGIKTCLTLFNPVVERGLNASWAPTDSQIRENFEFRDKLNYPDEPSCGPMDVSKFYCGTVVCITGEGWLVPCSVIRTTEFGNIEDLPLQKLVELKKNRLLMLDFRDPSKLPGNCGQCDNNSHCFGCRSSAYYYSGDILAADPKCQSFELQKN